MAFWGPLLGGAMGAAASWMIAKEQKKAQEQANAAAAAQAAKDRAMQLEFAQMGLRWRAKDAEAAGLSPHAALGFSGPSYTPAGFAPGPAADDAMGNALAAMGQGVSRARYVSKTDRERIDQLKQAQVDNVKLENAKLAAEIRLITHAKSPSLPGYVDNNAIPGQGDSYAGSVEPTMPFKEKGYIPEVAFTRTADGGLAIAMSEQIADRGGEDNIFIQTDWALRNMVPQFLNPGGMHLHFQPDPKKFPTKPGYVWKWHKWKRRFYQVKDKSGRGVGRKKATWQLKRSNK
jgi:hypothetical protein